LTGKTQEARGKILVKGLYPRGHHSNLRTQRSFLWCCTWFSCQTT